MKKPKRRSRSDLSDSPTLLVKEPFKRVLFRVHSKMCTVFLLPMSDHNRQRETNYKVNKRQEGINDEYFCRSSGSSQDNLSTSCQFHNSQSSQERRVFNGCDDLGKQGRNDFLERLRQYDISQCLSKVESL